MILNIFRRKGIFETILYGAMKLIEKTVSLAKNNFLKIRGYDISTSVVLRGDNSFFQSVKHSIHISKNSIIGKHTRISCGGTGSIFIEENVLIDDYVFIMAHEKIVIKKNSKIAAFSFITDFNHKFTDKIQPLVNQGYSTSKIDIGENVWIGTHVVILPGVKVGDGSVIGAGSIVTKDVPPNSVLAGNPAKIIRQIIRK